MYLKELEIFGFKSFPQKTNLKFESGITVVVGPNGCGKSNVFDSIKWALGEQSPKSLRGTKMEDIIFNGTQSHPALNYAEVTLTFSNEDRYLPIEYKEVAIARRLYRSGESQYFINKNQVRLKDVQELFMGTGVGESTYSFVEQGKIEIFLSYKPEDKRSIFDEASGIVKYKERKKETLRRLDDAEENLLRLEDIMSEVRRQIRYLERQVEKAKKFKEVQQRLIEVEKKLAFCQNKDLDRKINSQLETLNGFKEKEQEKLSHLKEVNSKWEDLNQELKTLRGQLEQATTEMVTWGAKIDNATSHIAVCKQRIKELEERSQAIEQAKNNLLQRLQLQKQRSEEETKRMQEIEEKAKELDESRGAITLEKETLKSKLEEAKKKVKEDKLKILELEDKKAHLHNSLIEIQTKLSALNNRKKRLTLDKAKLDTLLGENKEKLSGVEDEHSQIQSELGALQNKKLTLVAKEKELVGRTKRFQERLVEKEKELLELNATHEFLKDLRIKYETFSVKKKITVIFDEEPKDINKLVASLQNVEFTTDGNTYKAQIEAKVVSFEEKQLEEKIDIVGKEISQAKENLGALEEERERVLQDIDSENSQIEETRILLQEKSQERENLRREVGRLNEESELLEEEERTNTEELTDSQAKGDQLQQELNRYEIELTNSNNELNQNQQIIETSTERINEIDISDTRNLAQIESLYKEKEALASKISVFQDEIININNNIAQIEREIQENSQRTESFNKQIEELESNIEEDKVKIGEKTKIKSSLEEKEANLNQKGSQIKDDMQNLEQEVQGFRDSAYNKKLEIQSLEYEKEKVKDYLKQVYEIEFDPETLEGVEETTDDLKIQKEKLQKRVKSLGEVNLVAIDEFNELKERETFFETQKKDLVDSKENLRKAIQKINRTSKELFLETFNKIQEEFKKNFKFLFNGGKANLILLDQDNVLESGVEIEVQPPGKKLQNVSLLSGGEKALTAISLIFAIFTVRPSPLCVLDEIDAPLDEANVDRFNHLLKEFSSASQFILITHNKKTMSNADVLYGVTMQEKGISKLVSVKFAEELPS